MVDQIFAIVMKVIDRRNYLAIVGMLLVGAGLYGQFYVATNIAEYSAQIERAIIAEEKFKLYADEVDRAL